MADSERSRSRPAATAKTTAKRGTAKQASAKAAAPRRRAQPSNEKPTASMIASRAAQQLLELTGREVEGVTGLAKADDGWTVQVEVVEAKRIPDTTDVLALYDVEVDREGQLQGYQRVRRYVRGKPSEG